MTMDQTTQMQQMLVADQLAHPCDVTHIAVKSGHWSDPEIWAGGGVPGDEAQIHIPEDVAVIYDMLGDVALKVIRVDGALTWSTIQATEMLVETIVTTHKSAFEIGSIGYPISSSIDACVTFRDTPVDRTADPAQLGHGLVAFGEVNIQGATKKSTLAVVGLASRGDRTVRIAGSLENWNIGDDILILGSATDVQEEPRVVTEITHDKITFDRPLRYDHRGRAGMDSMTYVTNLQRNVILRSEAPDGVRGHVILHNGQANAYATANSIRHAACEGLGRTDTSVAADTANNPAGLYPLHLCHTGNAPFAALSVIEGVVVNGSHGCGIHQCASHAKVVGNIIFDTVGSGLVAQTGQETGVWIGNVLAAVDLNGSSDGAFNHPLLADSEDTLGAQLLPSGQDAPYGDDQRQNEAHGSDDITGFSLDEGDTIDLGEIARSFDFTPEQMVAALRFTDVNRGVRIQIEVGDVARDLVVIRDITAQEIEAAAPWIFDDGDAVEITEEPSVAQPDVAAATLLDSVMDDAVVAAPDDGIMLVPAPEIPINHPVFDGLGEDDEFVFGAPDAVREAKNVPPASDDASATSTEEKRTRRVPKSKSAKGVALKGTPAFRAQDANQDAPRRLTTAQRRLERRRRPAKVAASAR